MALVFNAQSTKMAVWGGGGGGGERERERNCQNLCDPGIIVKAGVLFFEKLAPQHTLFEF